MDLKRSSKGVVYREKILEIYNAVILQNGGLKVAEFDFLLLKPNKIGLQDCVRLLGANGIHNSKQCIQDVIIYCIQALSSSQELRVQHSLQTISTLIYSTFQYSNCQFPEQYNHILVPDVENPMKFYESLIDRCNTIILSRFSEQTVFEALKVLLVLATTTKNIHANMFMEYLLLNQVFKTLFKALRQPLSPRTISVILLLILNMCFYQIYEKQNPCVDKLKKCKPNFMDDLNSNLIILGCECKKDLGSQLEIAESALDQIGVYMSQAWSWLSSAQQEEEVNFDAPGTPSIATCLCLINILPCYWMIQWNPKYMAETAAIKQVEVEGELKVIPSQCPKSVTVLVTICSAILTQEFDVRTTNLIRTCLIFLLTSSQDAVTQTVLHHDRFLDQIEYCQKQGTREVWKRSSAQQPIISVVLIITSDYLSRLSDQFFKLNSRLLSTFSLGLQIVESALLQVYRTRSPNAFVSQDFLNFIKVVTDFLLLNTADEFRSSWDRERIQVLHKTIITLRKLVSFSNNLFTNEAQLWFQLVQRSEDLLKIEQQISSRDSFQHIIPDFSPVVKGVLYIKENVESNLGEKALGASMANRGVLEFLEKICADPGFKRPKFKISKKNDYFTKFNEIPNEISFFNQVMSLLSQDVRTIYLDHLSPHHQGL